MNSARADEGAQVKGGLTKATVETIIGSHLHETRSCFSMKLAGTPDLSGRVVVQFIVGGDGKVKKVGVKSATLRDNGVQSCIVDTVRTWGFPAPGNGKDVIVIYPFNFKPFRGENLEGRATLDKSELTSILHDRSDDIKRCYDAALVKQPRLEGKVEVRFTIDQGGKVTSSVVTASTVKEPVLERCIADAVGHWQFPKPHGDGVVVVTYPFNLHLASPPPPTGSAVKTPATSAVKTPAASAAKVPAAAPSPAPPVGSGAHDKAPAAVGGKR